MSGDRILLVEDDKEIREGVEIFLKSQGYEVFQAADGVEGLKVLEEREIDLAIVDFAVLYIVETVNQVGYGSLSRTGGSHKSNFLSGLGKHLNVMEHHLG